MDNLEWCTCSRCGYGWHRGRSGEHDCADSLTKQLAACAAERDGLLAEKQALQEAEASKAVLVQIAEKLADKEDWSGATLFVNNLAEKVGEDDADVVRLRSLITMSQVLCTDGKTTRVVRALPREELRFADPDCKLTVYVTAEFDSYEELDVTLTPLKSREVQLREARTEAFRQLPWVCDEHLDAYVKAVERVDAEFAKKG